jgi:hypothetical protein
MIRVWGQDMTRIESHLRTEELEARYETAGDPIAKSHFHGLWLLSKGYDLDEVAELMVAPMAANHFVSWSGWNSAHGRAGDSAHGAPPAATQL